MKITKEYCYNMTEIPASKMTRTFNALKRMNWVQIGNKNVYACIADRFISSKRPDRYQQYTADLYPKALTVAIQNNSSTVWNIEFDTANEYKQWIAEHMVKIASIKLF